MEGAAPLTQPCPGATSRLPVSHCAPPARGQNSHMGIFASLTIYCLAPPLPWWVGAAWQGHPTHSSLPPSAPAAPARLADPLPPLGKKIYRGSRVPLWQPVPRTCSCPSCLLHPLSLSESRPFRRSGPRCPRPKGLHT